jgi:hypothetical protein
MTSGAGVPARTSSEEVKTADNRPVGRPRRFTTKKVGKRNNILQSSRKE